MPKINDYSAPQVGGQGGSFNTYSGLRQTGETGQALQRAGAVVSDFGDRMIQRQEQEETSDINAKFSEANAQFTADIEKRVQEGTIDAAQVQEEVRKHTDSLNQNISTYAGRRAFERNAAALQAGTTRMATRGQALVAGAKAVANVKSQLDNNSSALINDPSQFGALYEMTMASIDDQVETGGLPAIEAEKLRRAAGGDLAKSAVRGWANLSPDIAQKKLNNGEFDKYFDGDVKAQMQGYINQQQSAREIEERRREMAQERAMKKRSEAAQNRMLPAIIKGELPTDQIVNSPDLKYDDKVAMIKLQDWATRERTQVDHGVENEIFRRINLPDGDPNQIISMNQMMPYLGRGMTPESIVKMAGWLDNTEDGARKKANRKGLVDYAEARLVKKDSFGMPDPKGQLLLNQFISDLQEKERQLADDPKALAELYNPKSPNYFAYEADKYKRSQKDIMKDTVMDMKKASLKNQIDYTKPKSVLVPRKDGESPRDWIKRRRGG